MAYIRFSPYLTVAIGSSPLTIEATAPG